METRTIVIKVQYGEIRRRLSVKVGDLSMGVLNEKILNLLKFGTDAEIMLSFTDEDGDSVVLVDDEDLTEMVKQQQSPLRINVKLIGNARFFLPPNPSSFVESAMPDNNYAHSEHARRGSQGPQVQPKLDNHCVNWCDYRQYNILVLPSSPFSRIWRVRNTGTVPWPQKTRLIWIEGYKLTNLSSVELKIPASGLPVGQEMDVAVDFISPELTGPFVSYWRMISPSGEKFGERLWVLIEVTHPMRTVFFDHGNGYPSSALPASSSYYPFPARKVEVRGLQLMAGAEFSITPMRNQRRKWMPKM